MIEKLGNAGYALTILSGKAISDLTEDLECSDYFGCNFLLGTFNVKFRKAKTTPKKIGQFVTLWKRNSNGQTEPFCTEDDFDFYVIATEENDASGFFLFPKQILVKRQILTDGNVEGKCGFRVYPDWSVPENAQAKKTKSWQTEYFIDLDASEISKSEKYNAIVSLSGFSSKSKKKADIKSTLFDLWNWLWLIVIHFGQSPELIFFLEK